MRHPLALVGFTAASLALSALAHADDVLAISQVNVDPATLHTIGVQVLISGDDNRNASIAVRVRPHGASTWKNGMPLLRVMPETVTGLTVPQQFAGSVFDLDPGTSYDVELHAEDPDGNVDVTKVVTTSTKAKPHDPKHPHPVTASNAAELTTALQNAAPGDVILVKKGMYSGTFTLQKSGTADDPIIIRGEDEEATIFDVDGMSCGCNNWEIYGGHVHLERMTIQRGGHAVRFFADSTKNGIVARRLHIKQVYQGIWITGNDASSDYPTDVYVCDNTIEGLDVWPWVFDADATSHWDDEAVKIQGWGVDACHNKIVGFGDTIINKNIGARAYDFYGNDISDSFDGTELDEGAGNARLFNNRWTNVWDGLSIQPIYGGPAYILRNVVYNAVTEQMKLHAEIEPDGVTQKQPSGMLIYHNTFVSPSIDLTDEASTTLHNFVMQNNLFVGPAMLATGRAAEYTETIDHGMFDYDGYFPDGSFWLGVVGGSNVVSDNFADLKAGGVFEGHGVLVDANVFANGKIGPDDPKGHYPPFDFTLSATSKAIDKGVIILGVNEHHAGAAPDLGALELGCPAPAYGPRSEAAADAEDEAPIDCDASQSGAGGSGGGSHAGPGAGAGSPGAGGAGGGAASGGSGSKGGCGCAVPGGDADLGWLASAGALVILARRRARRRVAAAADREG